jgi:hypothetical protein
MGILARAVVGVEDEEEGREGVNGARHKLWIERVVEWIFERRCELESRLRASRREGSSAGSWSGSGSGGGREEPRLQTDRQP